MRISHTFKAICMALALLPLAARAELMLYPTRVVLGNNQRAAQVELINNGAEATTYRIHLVNRRMSETGEFSHVEQAGPGEQFASQMLSYSPRQVTLQPGTAQVVRVMVRKPDGLAEGEYRSHLHFEKLPPAAGSSSVEAGAAPAQQIGVVLRTLVGVSIPVIVRHGQTQATVALTALQLDPGSATAPPQLAFQIQRSGNSSVYGDVSASFTPSGGVPQLLAKAGGIALYLPNPMRRAALTLQLPAGKPLGRGELHLSFRERPEAGGKVLAQAVLAVP